MFGLQLILPGLRWKFGICHLKSASLWRSPTRYVLCVLHDIVRCTDLCAHASSPSGDPELASEELVKRVRVSAKTAMCHQMSRAEPNGL